MYPPTPWVKPKPSFGRSTPLPGVEPAAGPLVALYLNVAWVPYLLGGASQLCNPAIWAAADNAGLALVLQQAEDLLINLGLAGLAPTRNPNPIGNSATRPQLIQNAPGGAPVMNS
jgi:hypothetical protein